MFIAKGSKENNPYARWIETYISDDFSLVVNEMIGIFDAFADKTSEETRMKMLDGFYKSACLEWHFWNDSYNKTVFDNLLS